MKRLLCSLAVAAACTGAAAQAQLLDFESLAPGSYVTNVSYEGYVISPSHRVTVVEAGQFPWTWHSSWLGISQSDTLGPANPGFSGDAGFLLHIARSDGLPFSVSSITSVGGIWGMASSNGGFFQPDGSGAVSFSGPEWTAVQWLQFGAGSGDFRGFDDLVLAAVPEPSAAWLLLAGLAALALRRQATARQAR